MTTMKWTYSIQNQLSRYQFKVKNSMGLLDSFSPLKVVDRGYTLATKNKKVVRSIRDVQANDVIELKVKDGLISTVVQSAQS